MPFIRTAIITSAILFSLSACKDASDPSPSVSLKSSSVDTTSGTQAAGPRGAKNGEIDFHHGEGYRI